MIDHLETDSEAVSKGPCDDCGSSDACVEYSDGHTYCFSCNHYEPSSDSGSVSVPTASNGTRAKGLTNLSDAEVRAIKSRKISQETCAKYGYVIHNGKQVARYYKERRLSALHYRTHDKQFFWEGDQKGIELFGQHLWRKGGRKLTITEGELDCLSIAEVWKCKWPVVSLPSGAQSAVKAIRNNLEFIESFDEIVLAFDADSAGQQAVEKVVPLLPPGKVVVVDYPEGCKDASDTLVKVGHEAVQRMVWDAKPYRPDGIVHASSLRDEIVEFYHKGYDGVQYDCPLPLTNYMTNGYRKGELWTHTAGSGIGKSTIVTQIVGYHLMNIPSCQESIGPCTIGHVALEENNKQTVLRYMSLDMNTPLHLGVPEGIDEKDYVAAFDRQSERLYEYDHFGSLEADNLLSKLRYLAVGCSCDFIILDHISIAVSGMDQNEDERRTIDKLMTDLRSLVENTGVGIHIISHLRKAHGKSHEEGGRVTLDDLRGSASIKQLSDCIIGYERDQQDPEDSNKTQVRVLKCRLTGRTGQSDVLEYDEDSGWLKVVSEARVEPQEETNWEDF